MNPKSLLKLFKKYSKNNMNVYADTPDSGLMGIDEYASSGSTSFYSLETSSTSGGVHNLYEKQFDVSPLRHYMKKWFPFVKDILDVKGGKGVTKYNPMTFNAITSSRFEIHILVSPTHFAETFSNQGLDSALKKHMNDKVTPLLKCMYSEFSGEPTYLFFPEKTETLLEYIKEDIYSI